MGSLLLVFPKEGLWYPGPSFFQIFGNYVMDIGTLRIHHSEYSTALSHQLKTGIRKLGFPVFLEKEL